MAEEQLIQINQASQIDILGQHIATNHLIVQQIMQHLTKEDLLVFSSINKAWNKKARACLKKNHKCQIILGKEPCRALLALNALLAEQTTSFYNGIKHYYGKKYTDKFVDKYGDKVNEMCYANCLSQEHGKFDRDSICRMYSNILKCTRLEYITFNDESWNVECPFLLLIPIILQEKGDFIKEFRLKPTCRQCFRWHPILKQHIYPNLHTIDVSDLEDSIVNKSLPNVRRIFNRLVHSRFASVNGAKSHLYTRADICDHRHPFFYMTVRPIWKHLQVRLNTSVDNFTERFLWASNSICYTLKELHCCLTLLSILSNLPSVPQFWALKTILSGVKTPDNRNHWSYLVKTINWDYFAPNLYFVNLGEGYYRTPEELLLEQPTEIHRRSFQSLSTRKLEAMLEDTDIIALTFPKIAKLSIDEVKIFDILGRAAIFPDLKELRFGLIDMEYTNLDFFLDMHADEIEEIGQLSFQEIQRLCIIPNKQSLLNRPGLKRIFLAWCITNTGLRKNIMSAGAAALISSKLPGFCLELVFYRRKDFEVPWRNDGIDIDHLRPYACVQTIPNEQDYSICVSYRIIFNQQQ